MKDYITKALKTESRPTPELLGRLSNKARVIHAFMGLSTEVGELIDAFKRHIFYDSPLDLVNIDEEIGDILWYLAILMDECSTDFDTCMKSNIEKLAARYGSKFTGKKAIKRNLAKERKALEGQLSLKFNGDESCQRTK